MQRRMPTAEEQLHYLSNMCGQRDLFDYLDETIQGLVTFGDTSKVPFKGKGNIPIKLKNDDHSYIADVYYVPAIKQNLVSIGQLMEKKLYSLHKELSSDNYRLQ